MRFLRTTTRTPIGLDIGARHVKAVQLERAHGPSEWRLAAAALFPRTSVGTPLESEELRQITDVLDRRGFHGNRIVVPIPADKLIGGVLEIPSRTSAVPVDQIARMEVARTHRCPPDSFEMGCWDLPAPARAKSTSQVMTVGCAHAEAEKLLSSFESHGFEVTALDVRSCALSRAAAARVNVESGISAILDLGWDSAMVVMLYGGAIVYSRALADAGTRSLHESLHKTLALDFEVSDYLLSQVGLSSSNRPDDATAIELPADARKLLAGYVDSIVQELNVSFSYVSHEYPETPLARLLLSGSGAAMPGLRDHLKTALSVEVSGIAPPDVVECPPGLQELGSSPALTAAVGLAQFEEHINLIPQRHREIRLRKRHIRWCAAACAAYTLAAAAAGAAAIYSWGGEDPAVKQQLAHVNQEIQRTEHTLSSTRTRLAATQMVLDADHQIVDRPDWSQLLVLLAREARGQIVLRTCQLHPSPARGTDPSIGFVLSTGGIGRTPQDAQEFAVRLQESGMFDRVTLLDTRREPFFDMPATSFRIECELGTAKAAAGKEPR
ncbi:MAG TPA: pilus assembly protein PilM [Tepidisphaeraceae bacterium]|nr:pilus assembly protein PilM [Tepidisphaeraceae bacterium]